MKLELVVDWIMFSRQANLTVHRLSQTGKEAIDVGVSCVVDSDVGMAVLCEATRLAGQSHFRQVSLKFANLGPLHERHSRSRFSRQVPVHN
jgi:hypothetical protein